MQGAENRWQAIGDRARKLKNRPLFDFYDPSPAAVSFVLVLAVGAWSWPFTVDDAFIVARYGARLTEGKGYTMNDGPPSDGVTGPLWVLPTAAARALSLQPMVAVKLLGLFCMALAAAFCVERLRTRTGGRAMAWTAVWLLAVQPTLGIWGAAGLETGAATLAFSIALLAVTQRRRPRPWLSGAAIACLAWLRPEMALGSALLLPYSSAIAARVTGPSL